MPGALPNEAKNGKKNISPKCYGKEWNSISKDISAKIDNFIRDGCWEYSDKISLKTI